MKKFLFDDTSLWAAFHVTKSAAIGDSLIATGIPSGPIIIQQPAVEEPDPSVDGDWVQMTADGTAYQLDADNLTRVIAGNIGTVRLLRTDTSVNVELAKAR